jgi:hypothetical protein
MEYLLFFIGADCPHCETMRGLVARLKDDLGITVQEREVWGNESNYRLLENYLVNHDCPGVPVFVNTKTGVILCGEVSYKQITAWATGGNVIQ